MWERINVYFKNRAERLPPERRPRDNSLYWYCTNNIEKTAPPGRRPRDNSLFHHILDSGVIGSAILQNTPDETAPISIGNFDRGDLFRLFAESQAVNLVNIFPRQLWRSAPSSRLTSSEEILPTVYGLIYREDWTGFWFDVERAPDFSTSMTATSPNRSEKKTGKTNTKEKKTWVWCSSRNYSWFVINSFGLGKHAYKYLLRHLDESALARVILAAVIALTGWLPPNALPIWKLPAYIMGDGDCHIPSWQVRERGNQNPMEVYR